MTNEWAAGLFDGEGHIGLVLQPNGSWSPKIVVSQTKNDHVLALFQTKWGGHIYSHTNGRAKEWRLQNGPKIVVFLTAIRPHLLIKGSQADVMLQFLELRGQQVPEARAALAAKLQLIRKGRESA